MFEKIQGLYAIADNTFRPELTHAELAEAFLRGGAGVVQLRIKKESGQRSPAGSVTEDRGPTTRAVGPLSIVTPRNCGALSSVQIFGIAHQILSLKSRYDFTFILNDYVEIAKEIGADGVHVGADDRSVTEVRKIVGSKMVIGYSSHSLEEAVAAEKAGADYVAFGAIFPTKTKGPGHPVQGLEKLRAVVQALKVPVVAIGGINKENMKAVLETGAGAVAMITALTKPVDIVEAVRSVVCGPWSVVQPL